MTRGIRPRIRRAFRLALRRGDLTDAEVDEELRFHVDMRVAQLVARGLTSDEARAEARRRFGASWDDAVSRIHEAGHLREERLAMRERFEAAVHDMSYATRTLARQPAFAALVVLTFALGIGANATMFGVIDRLLLRPPPHVNDPAALMEVGLVATDMQGKRYVNSTLFYPLYKLVRADTVAFSHAAVETGASKATLGSGVDAEQIYFSLVNAGYFDALGVRPSLGRFFVASEDSEAGGAGAVVISHGFWQRRFGGDPAIVGKALQIGGSVVTVVGVAPPTFTGVSPSRVDAWIPIGSAGTLNFVADWATSWGSYWLTIYARLRPGVVPATANERLAVAYAAAYEAANADTRRQMDSDRPQFELSSILPSEQLKEHPEANVARLLAVVATLVLLIACANVANLLLARGAERRREIAVRLALGVPRARLVRLLLAETVLLAVIGGVAAVVVAMGGVRLLHATLLQGFAWTEAAFGGRVLVATMALVVITICLAGLAPAFRASRPNVTESLKTGGREGSVQHSRARTMLLVVQAALSVVLVIGAGLFVQSLRTVASLRLGYEPEHVIAATMDLGSLDYDGAARASIFDAIRQRVLAIPGVASAAAASTHPLHGWSYGLSIRVPGRDSLPQAANGGPYYNIIGPDYFSALGLRIVEGRAIEDADIATRGRVVVLSEPMARAYWPSERAVGQCVMLGDDSTCTTVIGVAANARERVNRNVERFLIYVPIDGRWTAETNVLLVRASGDDVGRLVPLIRSVMQTAAPNLPYADVRPLPALLAPQLRPWKMGATLFALFGGLALAIAAVGVYSSISYSVAQRGHEFGVRVALGARIGDIVRLVMGQGLRAAILGVVVGSMAALLLGRFVADLLFETSPRNPFVFTVVALVILGVATVATVIPAWRASRVDPVRALRGD
jgi:predicted permease